MPQLQLPVLQLFDLGSQTTQVFPPVPHALVVLPGWHALEAQQPLQESTVHMHWPPRHANPVPQIGLVPHRQEPLTQRSAFCPSQPLHATPPVPHSDSEGGSQVLPLQQLFGHDCALQTQTPPEHRAPNPQGGAPPQLHCPPSQRSVELASHGWQAVPAGPHCWELSLETQPFPTQHPEHDCALQTHDPPEQACPASQAGLPPH